MSELIVVHGYPSSGKSTHCERLSSVGYEDKKIVHISAGKRLRDIRTGISKSKYQEIINDPLAPSPLDNYIVNGVVFEMIPEEEPETLVLIDGYPRHENAVDAFVEAANKESHVILGCISLELSIDNSVSRSVSRGLRYGEKNNEESLDIFTKRRYQEHSEYSINAIERLARVTRLISIDANPEFEIVWLSFSEAIGKLILNKL